MENNIQVQKAADISSLAGVVIVSLSALTAYNIGEKFNHNILFDATIFIISLVMLILTFAIFRKVMAGLFTTISSSTTNKQVQSECSQESSHQNANQDSVEEEQIPDSLERYESILVKEQLKEVKRKRDTMIAIREYVVEKTSKYLSKENISTLFRNIEWQSQPASATLGNIFEETFSGGMKIEFFLGPGIDFLSNLGNFPLRNGADVRSFGDILPD